MVVVPQLTLSPDAIVGPYTSIAIPWTALENKEILIDLLLLLSMKKDIGASISSRCSSPSCALNFATLIAFPLLPITVLFGESSAKLMSLLKANQYLPPLWTARNPLRLESF